MNSYQPDENQGALERLGIPVQTTPPAQVLTAGKAKSTRFRVSRPHGYSYGDVESYQFDYVIPTLEWYAETLHQRDLAIHKLGELIDKTEVDLLNAKAQLDNKDYNEAIGLAVENDEQDAEMEALIGKVDTLQKQLAEAHAALHEAQNAAVTSPDGEETYTREEVEGFLASAVEDANKAKDDYYANELAQKDTAFAAHIEEVRAHALADAAQNAPTGYSEEEVHAAIQNAVDTAVAEAVTAEVEKAEKAKEFQYTALLESHAAALADVENRATEAEARVQELSNRVHEAEARLEDAENRVREAEARSEHAASVPSGYSQEELEAAIAEAVAQKEAEILANIPEVKSTDQIAELTNEGDAALRAENKTLKTSLEDLDRYNKELEAYVDQLEGRKVEVPTSTNSGLDATMSNGRPLPTLRPDDL